MPPLQNLMLLTSPRSTIVPWVSLSGLGREVALSLLLLAQNDGKNVPYQNAPVVP